MNALPLSASAFTDERIDAVAARLGLTTKLPEQRAFLRSTNSLHLQAAPGSGKTSLVALKLALVAEAWTSPHRGVCVLSHTNTATDEITGRLGAGSVPLGIRLLRYPHFVGTIQTFVHTFLALPALRSQGIEVQVVDNDTYAAHAERIYGSRGYWTLRGALSRRHDDGLGVVTGSTYDFDQASGDLRLVPMGFGEHTKSYQELWALKERLRESGIFRYRDMFAIAAQYLHSTPSLVGALRARFPFVLLDEMQDTDQAQEDLIQRVFGHGGSVVQCVGDINQRIFDASSSTDRDFPQADATDLSVSQRFGPQIAAVASRLAVHRSQHIHGAGPDGVLAVLVYSQDTIRHVVHAFERLATDTVPAEALADCPPRVVGGRADPGTSKLFPKAITCYIPDFTTEAARAEEGRLIAAARAAQRISAHRESGARAISRLWESCRELARQLCAPATAGSAALPIPALSRLDRTPGQDGHRARIALYGILTADLDDPSSWEKATTNLLDLLADLTGMHHQVTPGLRTAWLTHTAAPRAQPALPVGDDANPAVIVTTTASAKGETHAATLILECANHKATAHDLGTLLPVILGDTPSTNLTGPKLHAAQLAFVAATRPRHLLALAIHEERANPHRTALHRAGWQIHEVTAPTAE
ncbi:UvrD-helicase domain-containing protein [Streptomyces sp. NBC_00385]|uniref:UvrD-helicase domain-containing protein n=1 Tax=Streptomyces sp. NBC_00385 TaxID=2975733 RepID=UPI002DD9574E|nr:UvrD-helicase domain-containing protein [Streptomyces sp. NBC_00385]WRZ06929.1 UvrD-helicase domain-containing protein [Streptomyces sp. NBC_00385]